MNWSSYNLSLINRGDITFWIDENIARHWYSDKDPNKRGKQYVFSDIAIETALNIKNIFNLPLRALEGFLNSIFKQMNLNIKCPN